MLTQLATLKSRLNLATTDYDALLTAVLDALTIRFDKECHRTLARAVGAVHEFSADILDLRPPCYPIESVTRFELKRSEAEGWIERAEVEFLVRRNCVISLAQALGVSTELARVTYTGGYVLPAAAAQPGQTALPAALEQAVVEQAAFWFQRRDQLGVIRQWPKGGTYEQLVGLDLLPSVSAVLKRYERIVC